MVVGTTPALKRDAVLILVVLTERKIQHIANELSRILLYFGIGVLATFVVGFPFSVLVIIAAILVIEYLRTTNTIKKVIGLRSIKLDFLNSQVDNRLVQYFCMRCGSKHNNRVCPNCGSKIKKIG